MLKITKNQGSIQVTADKSGFYPFDGTITFPTNSLFTATSANTDMITFKSTSNGDVQFVGNYKDITISGRSYDTKQKFLTAFSNLANQGSVDAYTKAETDAKIDAKQGKLKAGDGITLTEDATDGTTVVKTAVSLTDNGNGAYQVGDSIKMGDGIAIGKNVSGHNDSITVGYSASATKSYCTVIGNGARATNYNCTVIGEDASALNNYCTVIGNDAHSNSDNSVAVGYSAFIDSISHNSVAVGYAAQAHGKNSVAIGQLSNATNETPLDICCGKRADNSPLRVIQSDANGKISLLKGDGTDERMVIQDEIEALKNAGGGGTVDAYTKAETDTKLDAKQDKLTAGSGIKITKDETAGTSTIATAVSLTDNGYGAYTVGDSIKMGDGIAIGYNASATGVDNIVIGGSASSNGNDGVAVGYGTQAHGEGAVAIGYYSRANKDKPLVIRAGKKTVGGSTIPLTVLQSDATGKLSILKGDGTDERIVIQDALSAGGSGGAVDAYTKTETDTKLEAKQDKLTAGSGITITKDETAGTSTIATAVSLTDNGNGAYQVGDSIGIGGRLSVRIGNNTSALQGQNSIAIGDNAVVNNMNSIAIGDHAITNDENCIAIGNNTNTTYYTNNCVVIGNHAQAASSYCTVVGPNARSNAYNAVAVGSKIYIDSKGRNSVAVGPDTKVHGKNSVALGYLSDATDDNPLVINAGYKTVNDNEQPLTVLQSDATGKISILLGDGTDTRMVISDEITSLKAEITTLKAEIAALKGGASTGA